MLLSPSTCFASPKDEFERQCEFFGRNRTSRAKLPEGVKFEDHVLSVVEAPDDWQHEAYPQSNRKFVHIYQGTKQAILIRCIAHSATVLDNPLFEALHPHLRIVPGQWITDPPIVQPIVGAEASTSANELADDVRAELEQAAARARTTLKLGRVRKPEKVAEAIYQAVTQVRSRKGLKVIEKKQLAIDYGALWGDTLCAALGWAWCEVTPATAEESIFSVCSPDQSHAVVPLQLFFGLVTRPKSTNNSLLLFNMIVAGDTPVAPAGGFCWLS